MTDRQKFAIEQYFGPIKHFEYTQKDEEKTRSLMDGIHESFYSSLLYLFKLHQSEFRGIKLYFVLEPDMRQIEKIRIEVEKLRLPDLKAEILKALPNITAISKNGRPKNIDTAMIEACAALAGYVWYYNLIPGKTGKPSKDAVYRFIYDFIKACGHTFNSQTNSDAVKDYLKAHLQDMDQQKIDL